MSAQENQKSEQPIYNPANQDETTVRRSERALFAALAVIVLAVAGIALAGILMIQPPADQLQGQADCDVVRVAGKLPGRVAKIYVAEGDYVHAGDTLVRISSSTVDAALYKAQQMEDVANLQSKKVEKGTRKEIIQSATNVVQQASAAAEIARKTYERVNNLFTQGVVTEQKRDEARAAYDAAQAALRTAQSQLEMARNGAQAEDVASSRGMANVARGTVREVQSLLEDQYLIAPCDGQVSEIYAHQGELSAMGVPVLAISQLDDMWVSFNVREQLLPQFKQGKQVSVSIPALGNKKVPMTVYFIHDRGSYAAWNATKAYGDYDSKTFEVKLRPKEKLADLRPGMSVLIEQ